MSDLSQEDIRRAVRVAIEDAMHAELLPIVEQHTRRMMVTNIYVALIRQFFDIAKKPEGRAELARDARIAADLIMKETA